MRWLYVVIIVLLLLPVAWYLISPAFIVVEQDDPFPIADNFERMDAAEMEEFTTAVAEMRDMVMEMDEEMATSSILARGALQPRAHEVAGRVLVAEIGEERILRFEDFETINGPQLHIYLGSSLGDEDFIDLGKIRGTRGNVNYDLNPSIDLSTYKYVMVWCKPFGVLFSYAELA